MRSLLGTGCGLVLLVLAGTASASTILDLLPGNYQDSSSWLAFDSIAALPDEEIADLHLVDGDFSSCLDQISCHVDIGEHPSLTYYLVKASDFTALYVADPGETDLWIDVAEWSGLSAEFDDKWPNPGGNYPGISGVIAISPMPEPTSALLFGVGGLIVGAAARSRARRSPPAS